MFIPIIPKRKSAERVETSRNQLSKGVWHEEILFSCISISC